MTYLLVDLGNSRLKWAVSGDGWREGATVHPENGIGKLLDQLWSELPVPTAVVMVSVAGDETREAVEQWVRDHWHLAVHRARAQREQFGIVNRYHDPATLGADRWVALLGARAEVPSGAVCVVSCGTAVTVDALTVQEEFAGGVIFPGLGLLRKALTIGTAHVRASEGDELSCLARSTGDAVAAGTLYGLTGAIERVCREFEDSLAQPMKLIITGGDVDRIAARLTRPARRVPGLVLKGLDRIARAL